MLLSKNMRNAPITHREVRHGFTMLELVVVIIILGIVSAIVATQVGGLDTSAQTQAAVLRSHLQYAQARALGSGQSWGIKCQGGDCWLFEGTSPDDASSERPLPGEEGSRLDMTARGVNVTAFTAIFNQFGMPYTSAALPYFSNQPIVVQSRADLASTVTLTLHQETGYVQ